jgi:pimeloyl-ACP methyl ester carboxylesterase
MKHPAQAMLLHTVRTARTAAFLLLRAGAELSLLHQFNRLLAVFVHSPPALALQPHEDPALAKAEAAVLAEAVRNDRGLSIAHALVSVPAPALPSASKAASDAPPAQIVIHTLVVTLDHSALGVSTLSASAAAARIARARRPLLLLHGHGMAGAFFARNFADLLRCAGYDLLIAPDLPGWGRSSRPPVPRTACADDAVNHCVESLSRWADEIRLPNRFAVLGHSLGAYLSHEFALRHPMRVERLVLVSPAAVTRRMTIATACWFKATPQHILARGGLAAIAAFSLQWPKDACYNTPGLFNLALTSNTRVSGSGDVAAASLVRIYRSRSASVLAGSSRPSASSSSTSYSTVIHACSNPGPWRWLLRCLLWPSRNFRAECTRPLLELVGKYPHPVEIISGDADIVVDIEGVRTLFRAMSSVPGNTVQLTVLTDADHSPHLSIPEVFIKTLWRGILVA